MEKDLEFLIRDKYAGDASLVTEEDKERLASAEPTEYVIGWIPFLGLRIYLESKPLIPRPETEWWTEKLIAHLHERFGDAPFSFLDLCAGSGAIGLSILNAFPKALVTFIELVPEHCEQIAKNIALNNLDMGRAQIITGDLFNGLDLRWDVIATNPPYIPDTRILDDSVSFEPTEALYSGNDGLTVIRRISLQAPRHVEEGGELWLEADISNIEEASQLVLGGGAKQSTVLPDQYERPRIVVAYY